MVSTGTRVEPCFIEPMYAEAVKELPDGGAWSYEAKLDGYRCLAANRSVTDLILRTHPISTKGPT
jgi:ATP-dependent DNA ligase